MNAAEAKPEEITWSVRFEGFAWRIRATRTDEQVWTLAAFCEGILWSKTEIGEELPTPDQMRAALRQGREAEQRYIAARLPPVPQPVRREAVPALSP